MQSQKSLRDELRFVTDFTVLCDVIQQVAVSQLQRVQERDGDSLVLTDLMVRQFFPLLPSTAQGHPFTQGGHGDRLLLVMTSDAGLVGPLHANVIRHALEQADQATHWILIGHRGLRLLGPRVGRPTQAVDKGAGRVRVMSLPSEEDVLRKMRQLTQAVLAQFLKERLRDIWLIAPSFLSTARQTVLIRQVLPLPIRAYREASNEQAIEPSLGRVTEELTALWLESALVESFWSARCAEFAARALHMESSREELAKRRQRLHFEFFKTLHDRVDVMVRETCVAQRLAATKRVSGSLAGAES